jgi:serine/threonine protein kinase
VKAEVEIPRCPSCGSVMILAGKPPSDDERTRSGSPEAGGASGKDASQEVSTDRGFVGPRTDAAMIAKCSSCGKQVIVEEVLLDSTLRQRPKAMRAEEARIEIPGDADPHDPDVDMVGRRLGDYEVVGILGRGGMGVVYDARQPVIGRRVAIKLLRRNVALDGEQVQRLLTEARAANAIRHPGIIDIQSIGTADDGRPFIVMEYLEGQSLQTVITERAPLPVDEVLRILDEILSALGAAHDAGVIHRDLKPSNVFLVPQPEGPAKVKLLDFGAAKKQEDPGSAPATPTSLIIGTPEYMPPEQGMGLPVTIQSDLYSVGVAAFEMLTGRLLFEGSTIYSTMEHHRSDLPPDPCWIVPGVPAQLGELVLTLLEKDPPKRPASARAVREVLDSIRQRLKESGPPTRPVPGSSSPAISNYGFLDGRTVETLTTQTARSRTWLFVLGIGALGLAALSFVTASPPNWAALKSRAGRLIGVAPRVSATTVKPERLKQEPDTGKAAETAPLPDQTLSVAVGATPSAAKQSDAVSAMATKTATDAVAANAEPDSPGAQAARPAKRAHSSVPPLQMMKARIDRLEAELRAQVPAGSSPSRPALKLLEGARADAEAATTSAERAAVWAFLNDWERTFLGRRPAADSPSSIESSSQPVR